MWCALRNLMQKDMKKYFVSYNMIAYYLMQRPANRSELSSIKSGFIELKDKGYVREVESYGANDFVVDLTALYYESGDEFFSDLTDEEMRKIMNIKGRHDKYKLLRYLACMVGSFNRGISVPSDLKGKIGGMSLDYFATTLGFSKPTIVSFNRILEENKLLFVVRHKDFIQHKEESGQSSLREFPNTYGRYKDKKLVKYFAETEHGYKYFEEKNGIKVKQANENRSLAQKYNALCNGKEYDGDTLKKIFVWADKKNELLKKEWEQAVEDGYDPPEPEYINTDVITDHCYEMFYEDGEEHTDNADDSLLNFNKHGQDAVEDSADDKAEAAGQKSQEPEVVKVDEDEHDFDDEEDDYEFDFQSYNMKKKREDKDGLIDLDKLLSDSTDDDEEEKYEWQRWVKEMRGYSA